MRATATLLSIALLCGCGGGGSADPGSSPETGLQELPPLERSIEMLRTCAVEELADLVELIELYQDAAEGNAEPPTFRITGFDISDASVSWVMDVDGDESDDVSGTLLFRDADGDPTFPFDPLDLVGGGFDLENVLASIEDGTTVIVRYRLLTGTDASGSFTFTIEGGTATPTAGDLYVNGAACQITVAFESLESDPQPGTYPRGTADLLITSEESTLEGTVLFDGTSTALLVVFVDGEGPFTFTYDLTTGEILLVA